MLGMLSSDDVFQNKFLKKNSQEHYQSIKNMDRDQDQHSVGRSWSGSNLKADSTTRQRVKYFSQFTGEWYSSHMSLNAE